MPSACAAFTSACCCSSVRIAARSIFSAASARSASEAACRLMIEHSVEMAKTLNAMRDRCVPNRPIQPLQRTTKITKPTKIFFVTFVCFVVPYRLQREQLVHLPLAVRELVHPQADLLEQRQMEIGQRRRFGVLDVAPALEISGGAAGDEHRQVH